VARSSCGCTSDHVGGPGFDLTEAGTQKRLAVYLVHDPQEVPGISASGPTRCAPARSSVMLLAGAPSGSRQLVVEQQVIAGIGNAYSDRSAHRQALAVRHGGPALVEQSTSCMPRCARCSPTPSSVRGQKPPN